MKRSILIAVLLGISSAAASAPLFAQSIEGANHQSDPSPAARAKSEEDPDKGVTVYEKFEGDASGTATILDLNSTAGYNWNRHFGVEIGVPLYFVIPRPTAVATSYQTMGFGNAYADVHWKFQDGWLAYRSSIAAGLPTAGSGKGLGTGRVMVDWDNRFEHSWQHFTPYVDIDPGNGINNITTPSEIRTTARRPFLSLGKEVQLEEGVDVPLGERIPLVKIATATVAAYQVFPWGPQKVYSLVVHDTQTGVTVQNNRVWEVAQLTVGGPELVRDRGFTLASKLKPTSIIDVNVSYSRSINYALNTISFSLGFDLKKMFRPIVQQ